MLISGVQPFTLVDFKDTPACIVFTPGCNFRCGFCHNPEFVLPEEIKKIKKSFIPERAVMNFFDQRKGFIEGVVITGGEPTMQGDLIPFIRRVKEKGLKVKLDTNGSLPHVITQILEDDLVDYIAMDIKTAPEDYPEMVGRCIRPDAIVESVKVIKSSHIAHEFRTTMIRRWHTADSVKKIANIIDGAQLYSLQTFQPTHTLDPSYTSEEPFTREEMEIMARTIFARHAREVRVL